MKKIISLLFVSVTLSACGDKIPDIKDPRNPVDLNGKPISQREFIETYCIGKQHRSCFEVKKAIESDMTKGKGQVPTKW